MKLKTAVARIRCQLHAAAVECHLHTAAVLKSTSGHGPVAVSRIMHM